MKTQTYTVIEVSELEDLIEKYLKIEPQNSSKMFPWKRFSVIADLEAGQNTYHTFNAHPGEILEENEDWHSKTTHYVALLQKGGWIPQDHPVLLLIWY